MRKKKITISIHPDIIKWIGEQIAEDHKFASTSHAFEYAMYRLIKES